MEQLIWAQIDIDWLWLVLLFVIYLNMQLVQWQYGQSGSKVGLIQNITKLLLLENHLIEILYCILIKYQLIYNQYYLNTLARMNYSLLNTKPFFENNKHSTNNLNHHKPNPQKHPKNNPMLTKVATIKKPPNNTNNTHQTTRRYSCHQSEVSHYVSDITQYALTHPNTIFEDYMAWHLQIDPTQRQTLIIWIITAHHSLKLKEVTLHLAVRLIDRYCFNKHISKQKYHLLGIACLWMAAKFEEVQVQGLNKYISKNIPKKQILEMEGEILAGLNFRIMDILTIFLVEHRLQQLECSCKVRQISLFLLNLTLIEYQFCKLKTNYISAAIIILSIQLQSNTLQYHSYASKMQLTIETLLDYYNRIHSLWSNRLDHKYKIALQKHQHLFNDNQQLK